MKEAGATDGAEVIPTAPVPPKPPVDGVLSSLVNPNSWVVLAEVGLRVPSLFFLQFPPLTK